MRNWLPNLGGEEAVRELSGVRVSELLIIVLLFSIDHGWSLPTRKADFLGCAIHQSTALRVLPLALANSKPSLVLVRET